MKEQKIFAYELPAGALPDWNAILGDAYTPDWLCEFVRTPVAYARARGGVIWKEYGGTEGFTYWNGDTGEDDCIGFERTGKRTEIFRSRTGGYGTRHASDGMIAVLGEMSDSEADDFCLRFLEKCHPDASMERERGDES